MRTSKFLETRFKLWKLGKARNRMSFDNVEIVTTVSLKAVTVYGKEKF